VSHRLLTLPFSQPRQISQAVPFELESLIPLSLDEVVVADQTIRRTDEGTLTLAVAIPKTILAEHLAILQSAGLTATRVMLAPLAPLALLPLANVETSGAVTLLDVGESHTSIVLLRDGILVDWRTVETGLSHTADLQAFLQKLRWTLLALGADEPLLPTKIFLCGGGAHFTHLQTELEREFSAEVVPLQHLAIPSVAELRREEQSTFATCLGLGLYEALRGTSPMVNLCQGEFAPRRRDETVHSEFRRLGWLAAGVAAAAGLAFMLDVHRLNARYQSLRQEVRRTFVAALPDTQTVIDEKVQLQDAIEALQKRQRLLRGPSAGSPLDMLRHLSAIIPEQITLDLDEWVFDEDAIRLRGTAVSFEAAEGIKTVIMSLGLFREAQLKDVKTVAGSNKVAFGLQLFLQKNETREEKREEKNLGQQTKVRQPTDPETKGREG
jgi:general secretion pathway protein L